jgi:UDP-3-O-[3-hydroxymyristoyl] N-acetylglucosamine deacetylase
MSLVHQHTIKNPIHCIGSGRRSGLKIALNFVPSAPDSGIVFRRIDREADDAVVTAHYRNIIESTPSTTIANDDGVAVSTVENLITALASSAIDNILIELGGPEVPAMSGGVEAFLFLLNSAGIAEQSAHRRAIEVLHAVTVSEDGHMATLTPAPRFSVAAHPDPAREDAANVTEASGIIESSGLPDLDLSKHEMLLDVRGDLYLAGAPIIGQFQDRDSTRALNHRLIAALLTDEAAWRYTSMARDPGNAAA